MRLAFDDDLEIGPAGDPSPALNDPGALNLEAGSRAILRGAVPEVALTATPDPGSNVPVGSAIEISWTIDDPVGVWEWSEEWPVSAYSRWERRMDQPEAVVISRIHSC